MGLPICPSIDLSIHILSFNKNATRARNARMMYTQQKRGRSTRAARGSPPGAMMESFASDSRVAMLLSAESQVNSSTRLVDEAGGEKRPEP